MRKKNLQWGWWNTKTVTQRGGYPITGNFQGQAGWCSEQPDLLENVSAYCRVIRLGDVLRSLPIQIILPFYDWLLLCHHLRELQPGLQGSRIKNVNVSHYRIFFILSHKRRWLDSESLLLSLNVCFLVSSRKLKALQCYLPLLSQTESSLDLGRSPHVVFFLG